MGKIQAILFDLDGTLLDSNDLILASFQHVLQSKLKKDIPREKLIFSFGRPLLEAMEEIAPGEGELLVNLYREFAQLHHDEMVKLFPEVFSTIEKLHTMGIKLGIVTSKIRQTALRGLELFKIDGFFDVVVAYEDTTIHKPKPDPMLFALEKLVVKAENALMVGDSPHDIVSAKAAGTMTAAVTWSCFPLEVLKATEPTYIINSMSELIKLVNS